MREKLFYLFVVISSLSFGSVEAKQKSLFRVENDTILHICSNLSEMDSWTFYERDESDSPYDYFISPFDDDALMFSLLFIQFSSIKRVGVFIIKVECGLLNRSNILP